MAETEPSVPYQYKRRRGRTVTAMPPCCACKPEITSRQQVPAVPSCAAWPWLLQALAGGLSHVVLCPFAAARHRQEEVPGGAE